MAYVPPLRSRVSARRRALELLAESPDGLTEAVMLAHGISVALIADLVRAGLATASAERVMASVKPIEVARVRVIDAWRKALAT
jgi:hypothetical protein